MTGTRPRGRKVGRGGDAEDAGRRAARVAALVIMFVRYSAVRVSDWRRLATFTPSPITE